MRPKGAAVRFRLYDAARPAATAQRLDRQWGAAGLGDPLADLGRDTTTVPLSRRASEALNLLASGRSNSEIAVALGVSMHTIERHFASIFVKIGVRNRAGAISASSSTKSPTMAALARRQDLLLPRNGGHRADSGRPA